MAPINAQELLTRQAKGENLNLLDVREEIEFHTYNIGGKNIPLSSVSRRINQIADNKTDELIVICKVGLRSQTAVQLLNAQGFENVRNLTGGLLALQKLNNKTTKQ